MLEYLYAGSFTFTVVALMMWFIVNRKSLLFKIFGTIFLVSLLTYFLSLWAAPIANSNKLWLIFRDLFSIGIFSGIAGASKSNKIAFAGLLVVFLFALKFFYWDALVHSFDIRSEVDDQAELLMELKDNHKISDFNTLFDKYEIEYTEAFPYMSSPELSELDDYYALNISDKHADELDQIMDEIMASGMSDWVEDNEKVKLKPLAAETPSGENTYGVNDPGAPRLWGFQAMNVEKLHQFIAEQGIRPQKQALIVILDTGVDANHEDISGRYHSIKKSNDDDPHSHGTHCAGIAASVTNNNLGIASFAPDNSFVRVSSIKVLGRHGGGTQQGIIRGILQAADAGADVISMSLGGPSNDSRQRAYQDAVEYANRKGAIVVVAAGNESGNSKNYSPANVPGVITVSAVDSDLKMASFSNTIQELEMGIAAPGVDIYSSIPGDKYASFNGTSMATPYVAGLLGMMKSVEPGMNTKDAYKLMKKHGIKTGSTRKTGYFIQPEAVFRAMR